MTKQLLVTLVLIVLGFSEMDGQFVALESNSLPPKREVRAVWLTTLKNLDWPKTAAHDANSIEKQKEELRHILDSYQRANINTVLLQTIVRASAIYPSHIVPWDACLTGSFGIAPGYDPLAFAISECHRRGMELHAWMATLPVGAYSGPAASRLRKQGYRMLKTGNDAFLDPADRRTATLVASLAREITIRYDIDGIHLDYIRYPETIPAPRTNAEADLRRSRITQIVRQVSDAVKAEKPWVKISCSPVGKYSDLTLHSSHNWNARERVSQDAQAWLRDGLMDQLYPMIYFRDDDFYPFAIDWAEHTYGRTVAVGLGTYFLDPVNAGRRKWTLDDVRREMLASRTMGLGTAHFRSTHLTANLLHIHDFTSLEYAPWRALTPAMTWISTTKPTQPTNMSLRNGLLTFNGNAPYYNIYGSNTWPVDISDARNLILTRYPATSLTLNVRDAAPYCYYAVTAMDRYGNESDALQSENFQEATAGQLSVTRDMVDLGTVTDNALGYSLNTRLEVRNISGLVVLQTTATFSSIKTGSSKSALKLDVSRLPDGYYQLFAHYGGFRKKHTSAQRLGFFIIRRR